MIDVVMFMGQLTCLCVCSESGGGGCSGSSSETGVTSVCQSSSVSPQFLSQSTSTLVAAAAVNAVVSTSDTFDIQRLSSLYELTRILLHKHSVSCSTSSYHSRVVL